jgi:hypothetical protein
MAIKKSDLYSFLWASFDELRGGNLINTQVIPPLIDAKYPTLTEADIQTLVVDDKWLATLATAVQGELDRVSQTLTGRIRQLAERYATPLPQLTDEVAALAARVDEHLQKMGIGVPLIKERPPLL